MSTHARTPRLKVPASLTHVRRSAHERGYVMAMTALLLLPILIMVAFAVDVGAWYSQATRQQRAADAASLAGVTSMPDLASATTIAREVAAQNGFTHCGGATCFPRVEVTGGGNNALRVQIISDSDIYFAAAIGYTQQQITRAAEAEYVLAVPMGSPEAFFGNDPDLQITPGAVGNYNPRQWLNIAGRNANKSNGDRYTSNGIGSCNFGCSPTDNLEFQPDGYVYINEVKATTGQAVNIDVFDPAFTYQGDNCEQDFLPNMANATAIAGVVNGMNGSDGVAINAGQPVVTPDAGARYAETDGLTAAQRTATARFCPGDQNLPSGANPPNTTYIVRTPSDDPFDVLGGDIVCHVTFTGRDPNVRNFGVTPDVAWPGGTSTATKEAGFAQMFTGGPANDLKGFEQEKIAAHYHRWYRICRVTTPVVGKYTVQVRTNADVSNVPALPDRIGNATIPAASMGSVLASTNTNTGGHNRTSIRGNWNNRTLGSATAQAGLATYAFSRIAMYANTGDGSPTTGTFYLARVTPEYAGNRLQLEFWDIADIGGCCGEASPSADVTILPPVGATNPPTTCRWSRNSDSEAAWPASSPRVGCTANTMTQGSFNGSLVKVSMNIPSGYDCDEANSQACWFQVRITVRGSPNDTTTWSAQVLGDPVKLTN